MELTFAERDHAVDVQPTKRKPTKITHFAWSDSPRSRHYVQAACGAWIRLHDESPEPTCVECQQMRRAHDDLQVG